MRVIAKKNTTKLVKGAEYEVLKLSNSPTEKFKKIIVKVGDQNYYSTPNNFTLLDGSNMPEKDWESHDYKTDKEVRKDTRIVDVRNFKKGDIVICNYSSKYFERNNMYRITDTHYSEKQVKSTWSSTPRTITEQKIKVEGYNRWMNIHRFRLLTPQEKRNISLNGLFGETVKVDTEFTKRRKMDNYDEKTQKKVVLHCLISSILDPSRNNMSITEWALNKIGKKNDINESDIKKVLNKKLSDLIKEIDDI